MKDRRMDSILLAAVIFLCLLGVLMVYSSSAILAMVEASSQTAYVRSFLPKLALGWIALAALSRISHFHFRGRLAWLALGIVLLGLVLVMLPGLSTGGRGTRRFLDLGPLSAQPAEFARVALVLFLASFVAHRERWAESGWKGLSWPLAAIFVTAGLVLVQPNLSSAALIVMLGFGLLFLAGQPVYRLALAALPGAIGIFLLEPYQLERVRQFWVHQNGGASSYQVQQSLIAVGSGGFFGKGLGEGLQKYLYLPFPHTDFILAVIGEELGFIGMLVLFSLFGVVIYRGLRIARLASDPFSQLLAAGITLNLAVNVFLHAFVVLGLGPVTGVPLPFISHGGSSLMVNLAAVGILLSISRSVRPRSVPLRTAPNIMRRPSRAM
ncbi:MAG: putative peptidoglycan glycosyltransferase FtsW [Candidatus Eisenbacteria bacterium]